MAVITDINTNRYIVTIQTDTRNILRLRKVYFDKYPLCIGDDVDMDAYLNRISAAQFSDAYESALNSLDICARSSQEIARSLQRKGYVMPAVNAVLSRLIENGLIDDTAFAGRMAEQSVGKNIGKYAFIRKLRAKGISEEDSKEALEIFDDEQQLAAARFTAQKLLRKYSSLPQYEAKVKLSQALARRGFSWDTIQNSLDDLFE